MDPRYGGNPLPPEDAQPVPDDLMQRLEANEELQNALIESGLPRRFQAMVLGLATIKQMNEE